MAKGEIHRLVVEVDKDQYNRWRGMLITKYGQTVSDRIRQCMDKDLEEPVKGQHRTKYGKSGR